MMDSTMGDDEPPTFVERVSSQLQRKQQILLDRSTVYIRARWAVLAGILCLYAVSSEASEQRSYPSALQ